MAGRRTIKPLNPGNSLDYPIELKLMKLGSFRSSEIIMIFTLPLVLTIICALIYKWLFLTMFLWLYLVPRFLMRLKKNKPKSWMWDLLHKHRLHALYDFFTNGRHLSRPRSPRVFTGARGLVRGGLVGARSWRMPGQGLIGRIRKHCWSLVPTARWHLTLGIPVLRVYQQRTGTFSKPIGTVRRTGGATIMTRVRLPKARPAPSHLLHAVCGRDKQGIPAQCFYCDQITPVPKALPHV